jgi:hypothetical protein
VAFSKYVQILSTVRLSVNLTIPHRDSSPYSLPRDSCGSYVGFSPGNHHQYPVLGRYIYADVTICMDMDTKTLHKGRDEIIKTF